MNKREEIEKGYHDLLVLIAGQIRDAMRKVDEAGDETIHLLALREPVTLWREFRKDTSAALDRLITVYETESENRKIDAQEDHTQALVDLKEEVHGARVDMSQSGRIDDLESLLINFVMDSKNEALKAQAKAIEARGAAAALPSEKTYEYDVFISYDSGEKEWVRGPLLSKLREAGLKVLIDVEAFGAGSLSAQNMREATERSRKTLAVLTPGWCRSVWASFEGLSAATEGRLVPLMRKSCIDELPAPIAAISWVDFRDGEPWVKLVGDLRK